MTYKIDSSVFMHGLWSNTSLAGAIVAWAGAVSFEQTLAIIGTIVAVASFFLNFYYRHRAQRLDENRFAFEREIEYIKLKEANDEKNTR